MRRRRPLGLTAAMLTVARPPPDTFRNQTKTTNDRPKLHDSSLLDQTNRRPGAERHMSRNSASTDAVPDALPGSPC